MVGEYVEHQGDEYVVTGSRVSLASLVASWKQGLSAESIRDEFPTLHLEQVYGAITYYLHNQSEINLYLEALSDDFQHRAQQQAILYPEITAKLRAALETTQR
jgi:uncharacterized protein (DUF433 family)